MVCQMPGYLNEVGDHRAQTPASDMALITLLVFQRFLTNHTKQVVGDHGQFQHQGICIELAGREAFNVHVGLQLTVILFALAMRVVGFNDFIIGPAEIRPPHVDLNIGQHEHLSVLVNGALGNLVDHT